MSFTSCSPPVSASDKPEDAIFNRNLDPPLSTSFSTNSEKVLVVADTPNFFSRLWVTDDIADVPAIALVRPTFSSIAATIPIGAAIASFSSSLTSAKRGLFSVSALTISIPCNTKPGIPRTMAGTEEATPYRELSINPAESVYSFEVPDPIPWATAVPRSRINLCIPLRSCDIKPLAA